MGDKRAKKERREMRELFGPLQPVAEQALEEANGNMNHFLKWAAMAAMIKKLSPEIPVEHLLPSALEKTIQKYHPDLLS